MKRFLNSVLFLLLSSSVFSQAAEGSYNSVGNELLTIIILYIALLIISFYMRINRKSESIQLKNNIVLSITISIVMYFLLAWTINDILCSIMEDRLSLKDKYVLELFSALIASIISGAIGLLIRGIEFSNILSTLLMSSSLILVIIFIFAINIPISIGAVIFINIINIGYIIFNIKNI